MGRIDDIERRLQNWARWKLGPGGGDLGYARVDLTADTSREGYREARIPTLDCEAEETDRAVLALPSELRRTIELYYLHGGSVRRKAEMLCCTERAVHARVERAHQAIQSWLQDLERARRQERARVALLNAQCRPTGEF